jgi:MFS family permease
MCGEYVAVVAFGVFAYRAGGAAAVGLIGVIQMAPAAVLSPLTALLGDRFRRERVVVVADVVRTAAMAAGAVAILADAPLAIVYTLAAVLAVASGAFYPAQTALVPLLARAAEDVTAAAAASSLIRNFAALAAPALAGALLLVGSETVLFAVSAAAFAAGAVAVRAIPRTDAVRSAPAMTRPWQELASGFRAAASDRGIALVLGIFAAHSVGRGAVVVLLVVVPLELIGMGSSGVGFLNAVIGLGGFLGAVATTGLVGRRRLAGPMGVGLLLTGTPLVLVGALPFVPLVLAGVALVGVGFTLVSVTGSTLLVRFVRDDVLARVLGVLGTIRAGGMAVGAGLAPVLIHLAGLRWTLVALGSVLAVAFVAGRGGLCAIDDASSIPDRELRLLRAAPVFAPILPIALERLATRLDSVHVPGGTKVVREGEYGDCVYLVADGELEVESQSEERVVDRLRSGDIFGEMALLRNAPRNATVRALSDVELYKLSRDEFLAAVTGHPASSERISDLVATRLALRSRILDER